MIHVECTFLNANFQPTGNLMKIFNQRDEFNKFYRLAKTDPYVILNVMFQYDPQIKPINDIKLLGLSKLVIT